MRIFISLIFFCLQKNTCLTEINGVFSCFAFFSKIILMRFFILLLSFLLQNNRFLMLKMKFPKVPKIPKIATRILTAMGSYSYRGRKVQEEGRQRPVCPPTHRRSPFEHTQEDDPHAKAQSPG